MRAFRSSIYTGHLVHERGAPHAHRLDYSLFYLLIDLDELEDLDRHSRLFGYNRRACLSFYDGDHGAGDGRPFRDWLSQTLADFGFSGAGWRFAALCIPRIFGYAFNPITVVYCYDRQDELVAMVYEVNNTFGERVTYLAPVRGNGGTIRQRCDKSLFVSPFFDMSGHYDFRLNRPASTLRLAIDYSADEQLRMRAWFAGARHPFDRAELRRIVLRYPATALKVIGGIHFEALRLWAKGTPLARRVTADTHLIIPGRET